MQTWNAVPAGVHCLYWQHPLPVCAQACQLLGWESFVRVPVKLTERASLGLGRIQPGMLDCHSGLPVHVGCVPAPPSQRPSAGVYQPVAELHTCHQGRVCKPDMAHLGSSLMGVSGGPAQVTKLCDLGPAQAADGDGPTDTVCGVSWSQRGTFLALGITSGATQIWDIARNKWWDPVPS